MIQLIYTSTASPDLASGEVFRIVNRSAANNAQTGLSGFLLFYNERFFQVLEGSPDAIDALMIKLESDPRHHSIRTVSRKIIAAPSFGKWRMKRLIASPDVTALEKIDEELTKAPQDVLEALTGFLAQQSPSKAA